MRYFFLALCGLLGAVPRVFAAAPRIAAPVHGWSLAEAARAVAVKSGLLAVDVPSDPAFWGRVLLSDQGQLRGTPAYFENLNATDIVEESLASLSHSVKEKARISPNMPADSAPGFEENPLVILEQTLQRHEQTAERTLKSAQNAAAIIASASVDPETVIVQFVRNLHKPRDRNRDHYNHVIANSQTMPLEEFPAGKDLLRLKTKSSYDAVLKYQLGRHKIVRIADVGGGYGRVLRELRPPSRHDGLERTLIDLFNWGLLVPSAIPAANDDDPRNRYRILLADAATVEFPKYQRQHFISAVESIWYLPGKLEAIVNLYNQLADYGILVVAAGFVWTKTIRPIDPRCSILRGFLRALVDSGIDILPLTTQFAAPHLTSLWIQKKPGTELSVVAPLVDSPTVMYGTAISRYDPRFLKEPPIEVRSTAGSP